MKNNRFELTALLLVGCCLAWVLLWQAPPEPQPWQESPASVRLTMPAFPELPPPAPPKRPATRRPSVRPQPPADYKITVFKDLRRLLLEDGERVVKSYPIGLGFNPEDDKRFEGDGCTPEGRFTIYTKNPNSTYHLSLGLNYPSIDAAERGLDSGLIDIDQYAAIVRAHLQGRPPPQNTPLGGQIFIHGHGADRDWTLGCIAMNDTDIEELYRLVPVGTPVVVLR